MRWHTRMQLATSWKEGRSHRYLVSRSVCQLEERHGKSKCAVAMMLSYLSFPFCYDYYSPYPPLWLPWGLASDQRYECDFCYYQHQQHWVLFKCRPVCLLRVMTQCTATGDGVCRNVHTIAGEPYLWRFTCISISWRINVLHLCYLKVIQKLN